jgi:predicted DNA binding CopG/RHH family protein
MADFRLVRKHIGKAICLFVVLCSIYGIYPSLKKLPASNWIQLITGLSSSAAALLVAGVGYKNYQALQQKNATDAETTKQNYQALVDKNTADRFSRAVEMLGDKKQITVRLGGIYSLERIAKDSPEDYHWIVMELLTAFVRENAPFPFCCNSEQLAEAKKAFSKPVEKDIQAILTVLGRRGNRELEPFSLNLTKTCLRGANFRDTDLTDVDLCYTDLSVSDFRNANLTRVLFRYANLEDTMFMYADLDQANFSVAYISRTSFNHAKNLSAEQIKNAMNWDTGFYNEQFRQQLGLNQNQGNVGSP